MKRIAIFSDGTWNRSDVQSPTNVVRLAQTVRLTAQDGRSQQVFYLMGVGSGKGSSAVGRVLDRYVGGALGWGLEQTIEEAYRALIFCYEPGDEIYIFGFSRGAYTARSLAGLIRSCGIPPRENVHRVEEAMRRYRTRNRRFAKPDAEESFAYRADLAPFTATSDAEWDWRLQNRPGMCVNLKITYLGVWDTVGALGVPNYWWIAGYLNGRHRFHDAALSRSVASARHAVAIDERRRAYASTGWDNLDRLNRQALVLPNGADLVTVPRTDLPYREEWFPGDHGSVGGGGEVKGLSAYAFDWIAEGAQTGGLDLRPERWAAIRAEADITAPVHNQRFPGLLTQWMRKSGRDRPGPASVEKVSDTARAKVAGDPAYRPGALRRVMDALLGAGGGSGQ